MGYSCSVPGCKSNYKKYEPNVTVLKFLSIGELRMIENDYIESLSKLLNPQEYV